MTNDIVAGDGAYHGVKSTTCRGQFAGCKGALFADGTVYAASRVPGKPDRYHVASGYCHPCAKQAGVAHHRPATTEEVDRYLVEQKVKPN